MAKYKGCRQKHRARAGFLQGKKRKAANSCSPRSASQNTSSVPSRLSSLRSLALANVKNMVNPFTTKASFLSSWCQNTVAQGFKVVKDTLFPSQMYLRELNTLREQLKNLETEFSRLQGALQMNGTTASSSENSLCQRCNKPLVGAPVPRQMGLPSPVSRPSAIQVQPAFAPPPPLPPPKV